MATLAARERIREHGAPGQTINSGAHLSRASPFLQTQSLQEVRVEFNARPPVGDLLAPAVAQFRPRTPRTNSFGDELKVMTETVTTESVKEGSI